MSNLQGAIAHRDVSPNHALIPARFRLNGESALIIEFGQAIDEASNDRVIALDEAILASEIPGIIETVPTYRSLSVVFEPDEINVHVLKDSISKLLGDVDAAPALARRRWRVPVAYGGDYGEDIGAVAERLGLSSHGLAALHAGGDYRVAMIGFAPGFAYLSGLSPALHVSRRENPRAVIPAGSIIVGGAQTAITGSAIPSGWHIVGRTPVKAFDVRRADPFLFRSGDAIEFEPIAHSDFDALERDAEMGAPVARLVC